MSAYRVFESFAIATFLIYSLRQILPLFPAVATRLITLARRLGVSPKLFLPSRYTVPRDGACSSCDSCSGCAPAADKVVQVITVHRSK